MVWIWGSQQMVQMQSHGGAREPMARNGGAQETWHQSTSTVSATRTRPDPVQESMWKLQFHPLPTTTTATAIILFPLQQQHPLILILFKGQLLSSQQWLLLPQLLLLLHHMTKQGVLVFALLWLLLYYAYFFVLIQTSTMACFYVLACGALLFSVLLLVYAHKC